MKYGSTVVVLEVEAALEEREQRIAELKQALKKISEMEVCDCDCYDDDEECPTCIALEALKEEP